MTSNKKEPFVKLKDYHLWAADESIARWGLMTKYPYTEKRKTELDEKEVEEPQSAGLVTNNKVDKLVA